MTQVAFVRWSLAFGLTLGLVSGARANGNHAGGQHSHPTHAGIVKVAVGQTQPVMFDNATNLADILAKVDTAADGGAKLVVFPELALTGYKYKSIQEARPFAEPVPGPATYAVMGRAMARNIYVAWGMLENDGQELYNTSVLVGPNGYVGKYQKAHGGYKSESKVFSRGNTGFPVFSTAIGKLGLGICYDANFPEAARVAAIKGAQILIQPQTDGNFFWHELVLARTTENNVYAVVANRFGLERFATFGGNSLIAGPNWTTYVRLGDFDNTVAFADLDLGALDNSWKDQRQPELYEQIDRPLPAQVMSIEYNPESQVFGTPETVVARIVTASVRENKRWKAELMSGTTAVVTTRGRTGPQGATIEMALPASLPIGAYTLRVTVDRDPSLRIEAPFVVQDLARPRAVGTRPTDLPATISGAFNVGLDRDVAAASGVPVVVTGGPVPLTFLGSVNTTAIKDNRFAANYSGLLNGTTYTATIAANKFFSLVGGAGNEPMSFTFTTVTATPFTARATAVQMNPLQGQITTNLSTMMAAVSTAASAAIPAKVVVFPELSLTGSGFTSRSAALPFAEEITGASVNAMIGQAQASNVYVAFGMLEKDVDSCDDHRGNGHRRHHHEGHHHGRTHLYNTYVLVGPEGLVGTYRKAHLSVLDELYADVGDGPMKAYNTTTLGKVGLTLSDSVMFPEVARNAVVEGATTILMGTNLSGPNWFEVIRTRASESKIHIVAANRIGTDGVSTFDGRTIITTASRTVLAQAAANVATTSSATLNIDTVLDKRGLGNVDQNTGKVRTIHYTLDRRPDLYGAMTDGRDRHGWGH